MKQMKRLSNCCLTLMTALVLTGCWSTDKQYEEGKESFMQGNYYTAYKDLKPLAEKGNAEAQYAVGYMSYYGLGTSKNRREAVKWMQASAAQNDPYAKNAISRLSAEAEDNNSNVFSSRNTTTLAPPPILYRNGMQQRSGSSQPSRSRRSYAPPEPVKATPDLKATWPPAAEQATAPELNNSNLPAANTQVPSGSSNAKPSQPSTSSANVINQSSIEHHVTDEEDEKIANGTDHASNTKLAQRQLMDEEDEHVAKMQAQESMAIAAATLEEEETVQQNLQPQAPQPAQVAVNEPEKPMEEQTLAHQDDPYETERTVHYDYDAEYAEASIEKPKETFAQINPEPKVIQQQGKYTVQVMASEDKDKLEQYITEHHLENVMSVGTTDKQDGDRFVMTYGKYDSVSGAQHALDSLPDEMQAYHPWIRNEADIQS